jgi:two-component system phosphate regulon sensor histidine kinase PhoR
MKHSVTSAYRTERPDVKTGVEQDNLQVLMNLLTEARDEADKLRERVAKYENILMSTKLLMGHELKKPTTALTGYLDLAIDALMISGGKNNQDAIECLRRARKECELLNELNLIFLAILRINGEKETLPVQKIHVDGLFREITRDFPAERKATKRVQVSVSSSVENIQFNKNALKVIVSNLIENALLYSSMKDKVFVDVDSANDRRQGDDTEFMRISVRDTGDGIPEEYLQKIFSPFVRLRQDKTNGSGLGLTLVRSLVELYGGSISADSGTGKGTTILVSIPLIRQERENLVL